MVSRHNKQSVNFAPSKHSTKKFQHIMINNNNNTNLTLTPSFGNKTILEKLKRVRQGSHYIVVYPDLLTLKFIPSILEGKLKKKKKLFLFFRIMRPPIWSDTRYLSYLK